MIHNERIKLLANLLNAMAGSSYAIGVAAPVAATFFYSATSTGLRLAGVGIGVLFWFGVGVLLHYLASRVLGRLRE